MPRPAEILYLVNALGRGGLENGVVNLLNRLPRDRYRFTLAALKPVWDLLPRVTRPDVRTLCLEVGSGRDLRLLPRLVTLFRRLRPDLVHTRNWPTVEGILAAKLAGIRRIVHGEHGLNADEARRVSGPRAAGRRAIFPLADRIVAVSHAVAARLQRQSGVPDARLRAIPNGVDTDRFRPDHAEAARAALKLPPDRPLLGFVGRLDPVKDLGTLLRAFAALPASRPEPGLLLVGDGPEGDRLKALAGELRVQARVRFLGPRDDLHRIYPALDLFLLPSLTEGMSNTLLEAMACGVPAIASRVGGNPQVLAEGQTGWLVPPCDAAALGAAITLALSSRSGLRAASRAARTRAVGEFSLDAMAGAYDRLYRELL